MPGLSGLELLERVRREHPGTDFVLFTANASIESAISALRMGAADYLVKPVQPEELALLVERLLARRAPGRRERAGCATRCTRPRRAARWCAVSTPARSTQ